MRSGDDAEREAFGRDAIGFGGLGSQVLGMVKVSVVTLSAPAGRNLAAPHSMARVQAADPVGRPPIPSQSS